MLSLGPGVIAGGYRLDRLLGKGGMGQVWASRHTETRRPAALKFLTQSTQLDVRMRRRFLREARAANAVGHPNVLKIRDVFELEDATPVLVMELLTGETLGERLARGARLTLGEVAGLLLPVVSAVGTAHALGIIHRDLKPDNVFLANRAKAIEPIVLDFGIAKLVTPAGEDASSVSALTGTGTMLGTPAYMAPEQILCEKDVDHRADVWAIGVLLYETLTGVRPVDWSNLGQMVRHFMTHRITPITTHRADLPPDVSALIGRMLERDRNGRPEDLREVYDILCRYTDVRSGTFAAPLSAIGGRTAPEAAAVQGAVRVTTLGYDPRLEDQGAATIVAASDSPQLLPTGPRTVRRGAVSSIGVAAVCLGAATLLISSRGPELREPTDRLPTPPQIGDVPALAPSLHYQTTSPSTSSSAALAERPPPSSAAPAAATPEHPRARRSSPSWRAKPVADPSAVTAPSDPPTAQPKGLIDGVPF